MYRLKGIGLVCLERERCFLNVEEKYRKALKYLDEFSHIHIFYLKARDKESNLKVQINSHETNNIEMNSIETNSSHLSGYQLVHQIVSIHNLDIKKGKIEVKQLTGLSDSTTGQYNLIDIKPYFPSEDSVFNDRKFEGYDPSLRQCNLPVVNAVNDVKAVNADNEDWFEVQSIGIIRNTGGDIYIQMNDEIQRQEQLKTGMYLFVYWWFSRFDLKQYREATQCNPPYEQAPKTGIFATRSPVRPNPVAMTVARITGLENNRIFLNELESFDKTPCIGFMVYDKERDCVTGCKLPKWLQHWPKWYADTDATYEKKDLPYLDSEIEHLLQEENTGIRKVIVNKDDLSEHNRKNQLQIVGARENNLKGFDLTIPYHKITAVVGVSGSGKSSLVTDTIYAECKRRMEDLSHNRNTLSRPDVTSMTGCLPAVIISQDAIRSNTYSTVGTYSNAYGYLRALYALVGIRHCPTCGREIIPLTKERIYQLLSGKKRVKVYDFFKNPVDKGSLMETIEYALEVGNGALYCESDDFNMLLLQTKQMCYSCQKLLFELTPSTFSYLDGDNRCKVCNGTGTIMKVEEEKLVEHPEISLLQGASSFYGKLENFRSSPNANWMKGQVFGLAKLLNQNLELPWKELSLEFQEKLLHGTNDETVSFQYENKKNGRKGEIVRPVEGICHIIERTYRENPKAASLEKYMTKKTCTCCNGERLGKEGRMVTINHIRYPQAATMTLKQLGEFCEQLSQVLSNQDYDKAKDSIQTLAQIAHSAEKLGIDYLNLDTETGNLSGGEAQRLKLLSIMQFHMTSILYIFDEPSKGLHPKDYQRIIDFLHYLKDEGNTIIMVEHNEDMIKIADNIIELGPGAGKQGGYLVGEGSMEAMLRHKVTQISKYMNSNTTQEDIYEKRDTTQLAYVHMQHLTYNNLKDISIQFPKQAFTCITGVSGSGKSSLMKGEIQKLARNTKDFSDVVFVDQLPIGKNSRSVVATYIDIMQEIRKAIATTKQAKLKGYTEKHFSFLNQEGQCMTCKGDGRMKLEFAKDSYLRCPDCQGKRYNKNILEVTYQNKNIHEILSMPVDEAIIFWKGSNEIVRRLSVMKSVGLGYLQLGQPTTSMSGGESSRLKLAKELMKAHKEHTLYLLDEPTNGLHFSDVDHLVGLIGKLIHAGNTVVAIEHNKRFIKNCDWMIELGPLAGTLGGQVVRQEPMSVSSDK